MKKFILLLAVAAGLATATVPADAGTCTTSCYGSGAYRTCTTNCY